MKKVAGDRIAVKSAYLYSYFDGENRRKKVIKISENLSHKHRIRISLNCYDNCFWSSYLLRTLCFSLETNPACKLQYHQHHWLIDWLICLFIGFSAYQPNYSKSSGLLEWGSLGTTNNRLVLGWSRNESESLFSPTITVYVSQWENHYEKYYSEGCLSAAIVDNHYNVIR